MRARTCAELGTVILVALLAGVSLGCAESSWEGALEKNTVAAYNRYLRDHPDSGHAADARERIAYLRVLASPTIEAFEKFAADYAESELLAELRKEVEPHYFKRARAKNTQEAYRSFLARYPHGQLTERARGNLVYIASLRDGPTVPRLRSFIEKFPESDFVEESRRTLALLEQSVTTRIHKLAVRVEVSPNVTQPERVRRGFAAVVARQYAPQGIEVVLIGMEEEPPGDADAWMRIDYHEAPASGTFGGRTLVSKCRVRLFHRDSEAVIWDREFEAPADHIIHGAYGRDKTLFANSTYRFWKQFFVPVSTWEVSRLRVHEREFEQDVAAIDVRGDRAVVLFTRGGFDYLDVSGALELPLLDRYRRERDLSRWTGIQLLSDSLVSVHGPDGLELVELDRVQPRRVGRWELPEVGSVTGVSLYDHPRGRSLLFSSTEGIFVIRLDHPQLRATRLLEGEFVGLHVDPPYVYLVQPELVEVTTPRHLLQHLTGVQLPLGKGFGAKRARMGGTSLYVFGKTEMAEISLSTAGRPKILDRLPLEEFGPITDLTTDSAYLYLLGERGLEVVRPSTHQILDFVQVRANRAAERRGRYLFLVGGRHLEIVDLAPYQIAVASPQR
ncbi:MAG: tol-pal system YbgF family protein [Myxococcota bacterium]